MRDDTDAVLVRPVRRSGRRRAIVAALALVLGAAPLAGAPALAAPVPSAPAPSTVLSPQARIEAIADRTGFDWRAVGGDLVVGCAPSTVQARCTKGAYVITERRAYIAPAAFTTDALLEYVVLHELAHLWQFTAAPADLRAGVMAPFGLSGLQALEAGADCLAEHWGATFPSHYGCPAGAVTVVGELYTATRG